MLLFCFVCFLKYLRSVQKQTIPALLAGRDAVVRSQTGSGESPVVPDTARLQQVSVGQSVTLRCSQVRGSPSGWT